MDDLLQQEQQFQPPQMPGPPMEPTPFTQADALQLQRLNQGVSLANQKLDEGEISQEDHQGLLSQMMPRLQSLQQRQKQVQQASQQAAKAQLMDQTALQESIRGIHLQKVMDELPQLVRHVIDPLSGASEAYVPLPDGKGGWKIEPVAYQHHHATMDRLQPDESMAGVQPQFKGMPIGAGAEAVNAGSGEAPTPLAMGNIEGMKKESAQTGQPIPLEQLGQAMRPTVPGGTVAGPRILNGAGEDITQQQEEQYQRFKRTGSWAPESRGGESGMLSEGQLQEMYRRARAHVPQPGPDAGPHERLAYRQSVDNIVERQVSHLHQMHYLEQSRKMAQEEHTRQEQSRATEHTRQEQAKVKADRAKEDSIRKETELKNIQHHRDQLIKRRSQIETEAARNATEPKYPQEVSSPQEMEKEVKRLHEADWEHLGMPTSKKEAPAKAEAKGEEKKPPANLEVNPGTDYGTGHGLVPETHRNLLSRNVAPERIEQAATALHGWGQGILQSGTAGNKNPEGIADDIDAMLSTLLAAKREKRTLTLGEQAHYETRFKHLSAVMAKHGRHVEDARLVPLPKPKEQ